MDIGLSGARFTIKRITTSDSIFPDKPNLIIENPFDKDVHLHAFGLIPNSGFQTNGFVKVQINGRIFIEPTDAGDFVDIDDFNMPIPDAEPIIFEAGKKIEVFIASQSGAVFLTIGVLISEA